MAYGLGVALSRWRNSVRTPTATARIAEASLLVFDAIGSQVARSAMSFLYGVPEHLVVPFEALDVYSFGFQMSEVLDNDVLTKLSEYVGTRLIETARIDSYQVCYSVTPLLHLLGELSSEPKLVYAARALQNPGGQDEADKQCIKSELGNLSRDSPDN